MDAGVTFIVDQGGGSVLSRRLHRGISGPDNGLCCGRRTEQRSSVTYGSTLP